MMKGLVILVLTLLLATLIGAVPVEETKPEENKESENKNDKPVDEKSASESSNVEPTEPAVVVEKSAAVNVEDSIDKKADSDTKSQTESEAEDKVVKRSSTPTVTETENSEGLKTGDNVEEAASDLIAAESNSGRIDEKSSDVSEIQTPSSELKAGALVLDEEKTGDNDEQHKLFGESNMESKISESKDFEDVDKDSDDSNHSTDKADFESKYSSGVMNIDSTETTDSVHSRRTSGNPDVIDAKGRTHESSSESDDGQRSGILNPLGVIKGFGSRHIVPSELIVKPLQIPPAISYSTQVPPTLNRLGKQDYSPIYFPKATLSLEGREFDGKPIELYNAMERTANAYPYTPMGLQSASTPKPSYNYQQQTYDVMTRLGEATEIAKLQAQQYPGNYYKPFDASYNVKNPYGAVRVRRYTMPRNFYMRNLPMNKGYFK